MSIRARAWAGLLLPPFAWFLFEQGLSALLHADCARSGISVLWGAASLLLCGLGLRCGRSAAGEGERPADPWLAHLSMAVAAIFALAILFQTLAILLIPACVR